MSRLVRHDAKGPALIEVGGQTIAVCQCGLSQNKPFCDGSHTRTRDEESGKLYVYTPKGERIELEDLFPQPKSKYSAGK